MSGSIRAAFFDVDGVLVDSLPQHLQICHDKAVEFGLNLEVPTVDDFRRLVNRGARVSPMRNFFLAVGFPEGDAERAVADYEREFMKRYRPGAFDGAHEMLCSLHTAGWKLGLVTSNTRSNVVPALAKSMRFFDEACLFFFDNDGPARPKSWCLAQGALNLGIDKRSCAYIGDQPADAQAAQDASVQFLGVTYGWGIMQGDTRFTTADAIAEIPARLAEMRA